MTNRITKRKWFLLLASTLITASIVTAAVFSVRRQKAQSPPEQPRVNHMPPVFSKVKDLEIVRTSIIDPGSPGAGVAVEIKNNSNKDALAVDLVCGEGGITRNGLHDEEHPIVVVKAHETMTIRMSFSEMTFGAPLVVSAVTWADGSEEGDEKSLRLMHLNRQRDRAIKAQKEEEKQKRVVKP